MPTPMWSSGVAVDRADLLAQDRGTDRWRGKERCGREEGVSVLRTVLGKVILVMSGPGRRMYQNLQPKPEGAIFSKRSKPQGTDSSPHDASTIIAGGLK